MGQKKPPNRDAYAIAQLEKKLYAALGPILRRHRKRIKLTQDQAAERLCLPQSYITKNETNSRRIDVVELVVLCAYLRINPHDVINDLNIVMKEFARKMREAQQKIK